MACGSSIADYFFVWGPAYSSTFLGIMQPFKQGLTFRVAMSQLSAATQNTASRHFSHKPQAEIIQPDMLRHTRDPHRPQDGPKQDRNMRASAWEFRPRSLGGQTSIPSFRLPGVSGFGGLGRARSNQIDLQPHHGFGFATVAV